MYLIIPDIHGRDFWKDAIDKVDISKDTVVFLGDYLDPYDQEFDGMPYDMLIEDTINNFKEILDFKKKHKKNVILLLGNHDMTYMISKRICKSRCIDSRYKELNELFNKNKNLFQLVVTFSVNDKNYVISHAGVHDEWLKNLLVTSGEKTRESADKMSNDDLFKATCKLNKMFKDRSYYLIDSLANVSFYRGGFKTVGSLVWSDVREWLNVKPYAYQIFGHTQLIHEAVTKDIACLDCKKSFMFDKDTEQFFDINDTSTPINIITLE